MGYKKFLNQKEHILVRRIKKKKKRGHTLGNGGSIKSTATTYFLFLKIE